MKHMHVEANPKAKAAAKQQALEEKMQISRKSEETENAKDDDLL